MITVKVGSGTETHASTGALVAGRFGVTVNGGVTVCGLQNRKSSHRHIDGPVTCERCVAGTV